MESFESKDNLPDKIEKRAYYLNRLKLLLNDFSDEIPSKIIHSDSEDNKFKVRAAWWSSLSLSISILARSNLIPKSFVDECSQISASHQKNLDKDGLTKASDIEAANLLIGKLIRYLEGQ